MPSPIYWRFSVVANQDGSIHARWRWIDLQISPWSRPISPSNIDALRRRCVALAQSAYLGAPRNPLTAALELLCARPSPTWALQGHVWKMSLESGIKGMCLTD